MPGRDAPTAFVVSCRADLSQPAIDELHARGVYLAHRGELDGPDGSALPVHRLLVEAGSEPDALAAARDLVDTVGAEARALEVEEELPGPGFS